MEKNDTRKKYVLNLLNEANKLFDEDVELSRKMEQTNSLISSFAPYDVFNCDDSFNLKIGNIVEINSKLDIFTTSEKPKFAIVLNNSDKYHPNVLICPLVKYDRYNDIQGLKIGMIPNKKNIENEMVALIQGIKYISKEKLVLDKSNKKIEVVGQILTDVYIDIMNCYKHVLFQITEIVSNKSKKYYC